MQDSQLCLIRRPSFHCTPFVSCWSACSQAALIGTRRQMAVSVRTCGICAGNLRIPLHHSSGFMVIKAASCCIVCVTVRIHRTYPQTLQQGMVREGLGEALGMHLSRGHKDCAQS